ncbi:MAG: hypothetical protein KBA86_04640, partial [Bacteroidales bacterium]|nr:hypothetical protein [Bacteroidales bacterium]
CVFVPSAEKGSQPFPFYLLPFFNRRERKGFTQRTQRIPLTDFHELKKLTAVSCQLSAISFSMR